MSVIIIIIIGVCVREIVWAADLCDGPRGQAVATTSSKVLTELAVRSPSSPIAIVVPILSWMVGCRRSFHDCNCCQAPRSSFPSHIVCGENVNAYVFYIFLFWIVSRVTNSGTVQTHRVHQIDFVQGTEEAAAAAATQMRSKQQSVNENNTFIALVYFRHKIKSHTHSAHLHSTNNAFGSTHIFVLFGDGECQTICGYIPAWASSLHLN